MFNYVSFVFLLERAWTLPIWLFDFNAILKFVGRPVSKTIDIAEAYPFPVSTHYRPISVFFIFQRNTWKLAYNQLYDFLEKHNILHGYQFGFRKDHSTKQAIFEITDALKQAMDKTLVTCGVSLNFTKAIDTLDHKILLSKLYHYDIPGIPFNWIENKVC